ncbi:hypothetical protein PPACK8108_LOCUS226 [Phakopsora pachyrhizi]|uniref:CCHC-type domain-containing protein n=1 Tax=Phakopsora pachyrhizi TaxID=170000 RepID=A0AAV0AFI1_PHAPC|nr:hypothetical protein PPACK8108_LOCUS226 [Phakopsora pachyrhizi]
MPSSDDDHKPTINKSLKKFLCDPDGYAKTITHLELTGSNIDEWTRALNCILHFVFSKKNFCSTKLNFESLDIQEDNSLFFILKASVHPDLSVLLDDADSAWEAYKIIQSNFKTSTRFCQLELARELFNIHCNPKPELTAHFAQLLRIFSDFAKVGLAIPLDIEGVFLEVQLAINSYMATNQCFSQQTPSKSNNPITVFWANASSINNCNPPRHHSQPNPRDRQQLQNPPNCAMQPQNQRSQFNHRAYQLPSKQLLQSLLQLTGRPTHTLMGDFKLATTNLRLGNKAPTAAKLAQLRDLCEYCDQHGHWKSNCPCLRQDFSLPPPSLGRPETILVCNVGGSTTPIEDIIQSTLATTLDNPTLHIALDSGATITVSGSISMFTELFPLVPQKN